MNAEVQTKIVRSHPWEPGLGIAPFRFVRMVKQRGSSCDYCGTGITYEFHCVSSDGHHFKVGCNCIARCHAPAESIVVVAKKALKEFKRKAAGEGRAAKRKAAADERQARWAAERAENIAKLAGDPLYQRVIALAGDNNFLLSMKDGLERFGHLTEKQEAAVLSVLDRIENGPARKAASRHLGEIGKRIEISGKVEFSRCIYQGHDRYDPSRYLNKIRTDDGSLVVWFGAYGLKVGDAISGTASVKDHSVYDDERQTLIKNPRWKEPA